MSYIEFASTTEGVVRIGGAERARMSVLIDDVAWAMYRRCGGGQPSVGDEHAAMLRWQQRESEFAQRLGLYCLLVDETNKLFAHVHAQCEIHGWVDPAHREWFASMVERAYRRGLLRDDRVKPDGQYDSWQDVANLVRRSFTPVVTSYSVTDSWPDPTLIAENTDLLGLSSTRMEFEDEYPEGDPEGLDWYDYVGDHWDELGQDKQDEIADKAIESCGPRWCPEEWGTHWIEVARQCHVVVPGMIR